MCPGLNILKCHHFYLASFMEVEEKMIQELIVRVIRIIESGISLAGKDPGQPQGEVRLVR